MFWIELPQNRQSVGDMLFLFIKDMLEKETSLFAFRPLHQIGIAIDRFQLARDQVANQRLIIEAIVGHFLVTLLWIGTAIYEPDLSFVNKSILLLDFNTN